MKLIIPPTAYLDNADLLFTGVLAFLFLMILLYAVQVPQGGRRWWALTFLLGGLILGGYYLPSGTLRVLLVDAAAFVSVALVADKKTPEARRAALNYFILLLIASGCIGGGMILGREGALAPTSWTAKTAAGLILVGFGIKLALVPFYFWLPRVAEFAAPMSTALMIALVDMSVVNQLAHLRINSAWMFDAFPALWVGFAVLSILLGALLALAQHNLKRMLAFSTVDDLGYLILGIALGTSWGIKGALIGALAHAWFKVMLFAAVGLAEHRLQKPLTLDDRGLASLFPFSGAAFTCGALGMVGIPPLFGFAARWRLYLAAATAGGAWLLALILVATGLALLYYVRAVHRVWWGTANTDQVYGEPKAAIYVLSVMMTASLLLGFSPGLVTFLLQ